MEISDFLANLSEIFEDTNSGDIMPLTQFRNIEGYSSLIALSIIAMADEVYGVRLTGDDIRKSNTVEDLFEVIKSKNNGIFFFL